MKSDSNESLNTYIPAVWSPKALQHCLGKGHLLQREGQQHIQHFNLIGITQKVAGAEVRGKVSSMDTSSICSKLQG